MNKVNKIKCLVTGGAGFIGSHLVDRLLELGYKVIVVDDLSSGKEENLKHHKNNPNLKIFIKDICDKDIKKLFKGVSVVFHLAAIPRVQFSIKYPQETDRVNIQGTLNILEAARKSKVKRFVYSSSSSVYGDQKKLPFTETMNPNPLSFYAAQKLTGEYYCKLYYLLFGIETVCLRYFNVYGPRQDPLGDYACLIPKSINRILNKQSPEIYGSGRQTRDFTYVKDVVEATILAGVTNNKKAFGQIFNVGSGNNFSVNYVVKTIINFMDKKIKPCYKPSVIEPKNTLADIRKIKNILNWQPKFSFEKGIKETIDWFISHHSIYVL